MKSLNTSIVMAVLTNTLVLPTLIVWHYHNGFIFSRKRACVSKLERIVGELRNIVYLKINFSWCISLLQGRSLNSLAFLNIIVVPLGHGSTEQDFKFRCRTDNNYPGDGATTRYPGVFLFTIYSHGANLYGNYTWFYYKSSVAFFMTTPSPSVLRLSRSTKKGRNFNPLTVIGSGKINFIAKMWRGFRGCASMALPLFHSKYLF